MQSPARMGVFAAVVFLAGFASSIVDFDRFARNDSEVVAAGNGGSSSPSAVEESGEFILRSRPTQTVAPPTTMLLVPPTSAQVASTSEQSDQETDPAPAALAARTIPAVCDFAPAVYVNDEHPDSGGTTSATITSTATGDIDQDGRMETVVEIFCNYGGSLGSRYEFVFDDDNSLLAELDAATVLGSVYVGLQTAVLIDQIDRDGRIVMTGFVWTRDDPNCCPSIEVPVFSRWSAETGQFTTRVGEDSGVVDAENLSAEEEAQIASQGYTSQTGAIRPSCHGTEPGSIRRVANVSSFLNVRSGPSADDDVIMRLGPNFQIYVMDVDHVVFTGSGGAWVKITLPGPQGEEPAAWGCGWVHTKFVSSEVANSLATELE